jgi:hypothetical protein
MRRFVPLTVGLLTLALSGANCFFPAMPANMCIRDAQALCKFLYQCCMAAERQHQTVQYLIGGSGIPHHTQAECEEEYTKAYCSNAADEQESLDTGRADWDHDKAEECLQEREKAVDECDTEGLIKALGRDPLASSGEPDACSHSELVIGKVKDGDACFDDEECENHPDSFCKQNEAKSEEDTLVTAEGECESLPGDGDSCEDDPICKSNHYCNYQEDPPRCRTSKANGEPCDGSEQCESEYCDFANGECGNKKANGEDCFYDDECASDYCGNNGQCEDPPTGGGADVEYDICTGEQE